MFIYIVTVYRMLGTRPLWGLDFYSGLYIGKGIPYLDGKIRPSAIYGLSWRSEYSAPLSARHGVGGRSTALLGCSPPALSGRSSSIPAAIACEVSLGPGLVVCIAAPSLRLHWVTI